MSNSSSRPRWSRVVAGASVAFGIVLFSPTALNAQGVRVIFVEQVGDDDAPLVKTRTVTSCPDTTGAKQVATAKKADSTAKKADARAKQKADTTKPKSDTTAAKNAKSGSVGSVMTGKAKLVTPAGSDACKKP